MSDDARDQMKTFLDFFAAKRDVFSGEIEAVFSDVRAAKLSETMYSAEEVETVLGEAEDAIRESVDRELAREASMAALVVEQLLTAAVSEGVHAKIDLSKTEDESALREVGRMKALEEMAAARVRSEASARVSALESRLADLERQVSTLTTTNHSLETQVSALQRDKGELVRKLEDASSSSTSGAAASSELVASLRTRIANLETELEDARAGSDEKSATGGGLDSKSVSQTKQFRMLKELLRKKNDVVIDLRARLAKYEPEEKGVDESAEKPMEPKE